MTLLILGIVVLAVVVATMVAVARDGYRAIPNVPGHPAETPDAHHTLASRLG